MRRYLGACNPRCSEIQNRRVWGRFFDQIGRWGRLSDPTHVGFLNREAPSFLYDSWVVGLGMGFGYGFVPVREVVFDNLHVRSGGCDRRRNGAGRIHFPDNTNPADKVKW